MSHGDESRTALWSASFLALVAVVAALGSWWFQDLRYRSLAYRPDFAFYAQFAARAADPELTDRQTFNVQGDNMFGIVGREGARHLHQAVHLEPVKYFDVLVQRLGFGTEAMFAWRALVHVVPVLVLLLGAWRGAPPRLLALLGSAYVVFPAFLHHATFDLRPYQVLAPGVLACFFAVLLRLPAAAIVAAFLLALGGREEAMLLAGFAVVLLYLWSPERRALCRVLAAVGGGWLVLALVYFRWTGYELSRGVPQSVVFFGLCGVALAAPLVASRWAPALGQLACLGAPAAIVVAALLRSRWAHDLGWLYAALHPRPFVAAMMVLPLLLWWALRDPGEKAAERAAEWCLGALLAFSLLVHALAPRAPLRDARWMEARAADAAMVFAAHDEVDRHRSAVLCDEGTCQLYADFESAFHLNAVAGDFGFPDRGPQNAPVAEWLGRFEQIVLSTHSAARLEELSGAPLDALEGFDLEHSDGGGFLVLRRVAPPEVRSITSPETPSEAG